MSIHYTGRIQYQPFLHHTNENKRGLVWCCWFDIIQQGNQLNPFFKKLFVLKMKFIYIFAMNWKR
jgi:hypothetical protein